MATMRERKHIFQEWAQIVKGLFVFSFGVHLTIYANIGLAPWDCLGMGIAKHTPLNYGLAMTLIGVSVLAVDVFLQEKIGFGTVIDALLTGNFVQLFNSLNFLPDNQNVWLGVALMLVGFVFMSLGMYLYMRAGHGCGPRDALLVGVGKRLPRVPVGAVEILLFAAVLLFGWLLGGPVGVGTLLGVFGFGVVMQIVYGLIRFDPRTVKHRGIAEVSRIFFGPG